MAGLCCSYDCSCKTKRNRRIWLFLSVLFVIGAGLAIGGGVAGATSGCFSKFQDCKSVELSASVCKDQADAECGFTTYVAILATGCALCGVVVPMIALLFCCCCTTPEPYQTDSTIPMHTLGGYPSSPPYTASFYSSNVYPKSQYTASTASQISGPPSQRWPQNGGDLHAIISPKFDPTKPGTKQQLPPSFAPESYPPIEEDSYSYTPQLQSPPLQQPQQQPQQLQAGSADGAPAVTASTAMPVAASSTTPRYEQPVEAPVGLATPEYVHDGELVDHADAAAAADMAGRPAGLRGIRVRDSLKEVSSYTPAQAPAGVAMAGTEEGRRYAPGLATSRAAAADEGARSYAPTMAASRAAAGVEESRGYAPALATSRAAAAPNQDGRSYAPGLATSRGVASAADRERGYTRPGATSRLARFEPTGMRLSDYEQDDEPEEDLAAAGMGRTSAAAGMGYTNRPAAAASMGPQEHEQPQRRYAPAAAGSRVAHGEREDEYAAPAAIPSREEWSNNSRAGMPPTPTAMGGMSRQRDSSPAPAWAAAAPEPQYTPESATRAPYLDPRISLDGGPRDREVLLAQQHGSAEVPGRGRRLDWDASQLGGRSRGPRTHSPSGRRLRTIADLQ